MSFLVAAALAIGLLIAAPVAAHLLRRGRSEEREFPPTRLVPVAPPIARQRSRLEDRALLAIRGAIIAALALIGATPFVSCSRLSLSRRAGASLALTLVLDDSLSMRASLGGATRFERARSGARQLLDSAREGDAVAIVLAGRPARLALAATTDLGAARRALDELAPSDRATDLAAAVQMARSAVKQLPQVDKRVVVLSDLAGDALPAGEPAAEVPLVELASTMEDCGIVGARQSARRVEATVACSTVAAAHGRALEVRTTEASRAPTRPGAREAPEGAQPPRGVVGRVKLAPRAGTQTLRVELPEAWTRLDARLDGSDALAHDDVAPVAPDEVALGIGVVSDAATSGVKTGGPTVLEQALTALGGRLPVQPVAVLPDDAERLARDAVLIIDDPAGLSPEARAALGTWLARGGVALGLLGPRAEDVQLGSTLEPFVRSAARWEKASAIGLDPASVTWLGGEAASLADLAPRGRAHLDGEALDGARIAARWSDGRAFMLERSEGRGLVITVGLPSSIDLSDLALRPGFLALLDYVIALGEERAGPRESVVGTTWSFASLTHLEIIGPSGPLQLSEGPDGRAIGVPALLGRYRVSLDGEDQLRIVTIEASEIIDRPTPADVNAARASSAERSAKVDASPGLALLLMGLFALELAVRALGARRRSPPRDRRQPARAA